MTPTLAAPAPANDPVFQTSAGAEAPSADDDATIRAILQDMQSHQSGDAEPAAGSGKSLPANEAGVE